jgi:hypothetical protein
MRWALPVERIAESELERTIDAVGARPFELASEPPLRTRLFELEQAHHVLVVCLHHIAGDGTSLAILWQELAAAYEAAVTRRPPTLPALALQYGDHARWQRDWLNGEEAARQRDHWRRRLAGAPRSSPLPLNGRRQLPRVAQSAVLTLRHAESLVTSLQALARQSSVTTFVVRLAGFRVALQRATGCADVCIGCLVANRSWSEREHLIGPFFNHVVLRTPLTADWSYQTLLEQEGRAVLEAFDHRELPFEELARELAGESETGAAPLFQILFAHQEAAWRSLALRDLRVSPIGGPLREPFSGLIHRPCVDLACHVYEDEGRWHARFTFEEALLDREFVSRLARAYDEVLAEMAALPQASLGVSP